MRSRATILRATLDLIESGGFAAVNVSAVAGAAGVSRQTVYSIFGSREELVSQAVIAVATEVLERVTARLDPAGDPGTYAVELLVAARAETRRNAVLTALLRSETGNPLFDAGMMARARPVVAAFLAPLDAHHPGLAGDDGLVEFLTRIGITVVLFDSDATADDAALRGFLERWLAPAVRTGAPLSGS